MYTQEAYGALIDLLKSEGYRFDAFDAPPDGRAKITYLRHDIDYSPDWAADFARLNQERGVSATFCFLLRSPLYTLAAAETLENIDAVLACGQRVALHFAFTAAPGGDTAEIASLVVRDYDIARRIVPAMSPAFSWHNPSLAPGLIDRCLDLEVPGLVNLYSRRFCRDTLYKADSNWRYSLEEWRQIAGAGHRRMQLLFHPFQWMARGRSMEEVLAKTLAQVMREKEREFARNHVYRALYPAGLTDETYRLIANAVVPGAGDAD